MNTLDVEPSGELFVSGGDDGLVKVSFMPLFLKEYVPRAHL